MCLRAIQGAGIGRLQRDDRLDVGPPAAGAVTAAVAKAAAPLNQPVIVVALVVPILLLLVGRGAWVKSALSQVRRGIERPSASILYRSTPSRDRSQRARVGTTDSFGGGAADSQDQPAHTDDSRD